MLAAPTEALKDPSNWFAIQHVDLFIVLDSRHQTSKDMGNSKAGEVLKPVDASSCTETLVSWYSPLLQQTSVSGVAAVFRWCCWCPPLWLVEVDKMLTPSLSFAQQSPSLLQ
ncbi:hypothetical protein Ancab_023985 [Ancistrocladus abbreviatus]